MTEICPMVACPKFEVYWAANAEPGRENTLLLFQQGTGLSISDLAAGTTRQLVNGVTPVIRWAGSSAAYAWHR